MILPNFALGVVKSFLLSNNNDPNKMVKITLKSSEDLVQNTHGNIVKPDTNTWDNKLTQVCIKCHKNKSQISESLNDCCGCRKHKRNWKKGGADNLIKCICQTRKKMGRKQNDLSHHHYHISSQHIGKKLKQSLQHSHNTNAKNIFSFAKSNANHTRSGNILISNKRKVLLNTFVNSNNTTMDRNGDHAIVIGHITKTNENENNNKQCYTNHNINICNCNLNNLSYFNQLKARTFCKNQSHFSANVSLLANDKKILFTKYFTSNRQQQRQHKQKGNNGKLAPNFTGSCSTSNSKNLDQKREKFASQIIDSPLKYQYHQYLYNNLPNACHYFNIFHYEALLCRYMNNLSSATFYRYENGQTKLLNKKFLPLTHNYDVGQYLSYNNNSLHNDNVSIPPDVFYTKDYHYPHENYDIRHENCMSPTFSEEPKYFNYLIDLQYLRLKNCFNSSHQSLGKWSDTVKSDNFYLIHDCSQSSHSEIMKNCESIAKRKPIALTTDAIRGAHGVTRGLHIWKITWPKNHRGTHPIIGVTNGLNWVLSHAIESEPEEIPNVPKSEQKPSYFPYKVRGYQPLVGSDSNSWGLDINTLELNHDTGCDSSHNCTIECRDGLEAFSRERTNQTSHEHPERTNVSTNVSLPQKIEKRKFYIYLTHTSLSSSSNEYHNVIFSKYINPALDYFPMKTGVELLISEKKSMPIHGRKEIPDSFYMVLDMFNGTLGFYFSGQYWGHAFRSSKLKSFKTKDQANNEVYDQKLTEQQNTLYPIASAVWGHCEIGLEYVNGFEDPTLSLKSLCRYIIRKNAQNIFYFKHVHQFHLPTTLMEYIFA